MKKCYAVDFYLLLRPDLLPVRTTVHDPDIRLLVAFRYHCPLASNDNCFARSYIAGTNGYSNGIVPMLRANDLEHSRSTSNCGMPTFSNSLTLGKTTERKKSAQGTHFGFPICCEYPYRLLDTDKPERQNSMKHVEANGNWSLFCPNGAPGMHEVYGEEFDALYEKYEREGCTRKTIPLRNSGTQSWKPKSKLVAHL